MPRRWRVYVTVSALVVLVDQLTKVWARSALPVDAAGRGIRVPVVDNYFDFVLAHNTGAAFSFLAGTDGSRVVLTLLALVAVVAITWMAARARDDQRGLVVALSLMAGGAVGNLIDRIWFGTVTDFVLWRWHEHTWPVFNVADACLSVAIGLFVLQALRASARERRAAQNA
jgi:signal peptidase II